MFTKLGLALIKDGQKNQVINPTSHKVLRGYLKTIPIHPPIKR